MRMRRAAARSGRRAPGSGAVRRAPVPQGAADVSVRRARRGDLAGVVAIDARVTGIDKRDYWRGVFRRYAERGTADRQFLVADAGGRVVGFVIGEVRDWEFGSPPCGWVFAIDVAPEARESGVGGRLLAAVCDGFRRAGVRQVRTLLAREDILVLSFFRSQGMMAAPLIALEMELDA